MRRRTARSRARWPVSVLVILTATGVTGLAMAWTQDDRPDHDFSLAKELFGGNPGCPAGEVVGHSDWEALEERISQMRTPENVDLGEVPPIDFVQVVPDDPRPYLVGTTDVPDGMVAVIPCVAVADDRMVVANFTADFQPPPDAAEQLAT